MWRLQEDQHTCQEKEHYSFCSSTRVNLLPNLDVLCFWYWTLHFICSTRRHLQLLKQIDTSGMYLEKEMKKTRSCREDQKVALTWTAEGKRKRRRPRETWRRTAEKDRNEMGWPSLRAAEESARNRTRWRDLCLALCYSRSEERKKERKSSPAFSFLFKNPDTKLNISYFTWAYWFSKISSAKHTFSYSINLVDEINNWVQFQTSIFQNAGFSTVFKMVWSWKGRNQ